MRRLIITLLMLLGLLLAATPAQARWGHCGWGGGWGCGYRGGWGGYCGSYRSCGWGGGWGGCYSGIGYCGIGGFAGPCFVSPTFCYPRYRSYYYGGYGCGLNYGTPISVGYYTLAPSGGTYNANANFVANTLPSLRYPIAANVNAQTLQQFLGLRGDIAPASAPPASVPAIYALSERELPKMSGRVSNLDTRQRAQRIMAEGDTLFQAQNFNSALQRYKLASTIAPDMVEAYWRQGHAFIATKNFDLATTAFKRAIAISDNLGRDGFRLDDLYGTASLTKAGHLEHLAALALSSEGDSDAYFLIGVFLNYDGQAARAEKFFDRASDLAGISGGHIAVFLDHHESAPVFTALPKAPAPPAPKPELFISTGTQI